MTTDDSWSPDATANPPNLEPPAEVTAAAQSRQLGPLLAERRLAHPLVSAGVGLGIAAASFGLMALFNTLGLPTGGVLYPILRFVALLLCFSLVGGLAFGVAALVRGAQSFYVYTGGIVHKRNGKVRVVTWPEVSELRSVLGTRGSNAGKLLHYKVAVRSGSAIAVPLHVVNGRDEFIDQLIAALRQNNIPVN